MNISGFWAGILTAGALGVGTVAGAVFLGPGGDTALAEPTPSARQQPAPDPTTPRTPTPQPSTPPPPRPANCHPSYPTVCIPPPPPDLDCPEIPYRRFQVTGSDPHRFDADRDGIGCE